jgi:hypothetical protein
MRLSWCRAIARFAASLSSTRYKKGDPLDFTPLINRIRWYWRCRVIRMSSMLSLRPSDAITRSLDRMTSVFLALPEGVREHVQ